MAHLGISNSVKKLIRVDIVSDTVCPWCFVGKKNLEKAMNASKDLYAFEVQWHPYLLNPSAPKEGVTKIEYYKMKFGEEQSKQILSRMTKVFQGLGFDYDTSGLTGSTLDSHRLIEFAGHQGLDKQNMLVETLFLSYFCEGKFIGDRQVLLEAANKVGITGAEELLNDPNKGLAEVEEEVRKNSTFVRGVPHFTINGKHKLSGAQPPEVFLNAFQAVANENSQS
ncbi:uncharacterized protein LOC116257298 isoform X2 [Nymphaea colorata]|nr:uncharacterized protein LOC116257298 isoform X2 [Nymphaea colorata]XP_031489773.1 uncharacterized protein LOC116257298 isoform X2 [Nymphaea colorata]XP_031489774.1 uncharacterized protein LOC116257298 isoform X2 [Nymphaea colorata]XP_049934568.1 uncharacterized protein LOC116257298 isoform X2 [Nymphaea colorata]